MSANRQQVIKSWLHLYRIHPLQLCVFLWQWATFILEMSMFLGKQLDDYAV